MVGLSLGNYVVVSKPALRISVSSVMIDMVAFARSNQLIT